jgi:hypothetical protein
MAARKQLLKLIPSLQIWCWVQAYCPLSLAYERNVRVAAVEQVYVIDETDEMCRCFVVLQVSVPTIRSNDTFFRTIAVILSRSCTSSCVVISPLFVFFSAHVIKARCCIRQLAIYLASAPSLG